MTAKFNWISPSNTMVGWDLLTYVKKRKKTVITMVASILLYIITNNEIASIIAGGSVEMGFALVEYYLKNIEL